jgi:hypothetical protein
VGENGLEREEKGKKKKFIHTTVNMMHAIACLERILRSPPEVSSPFTGEIDCLHSSICSGWAGNLWYLRPERGLFWDDLDEVVGRIFFGALQTALSFFVS